MILMRLLQFVLLKQLSAGSSAPLHSLHGFGNLSETIKNEFMMNWDGLRTKDKERILVLAATNRPFDLDEAVIRRLPRSAKDLVKMLHADAKEWLLAVEVRGGQLWGIDVYTYDSNLVAGYCRPTASPPQTAIQELRATICMLQLSPDVVQELD
ncbi:uncharacterized protein DS421_12g375800 [Arachis hypogaea]|nr:uncharacterized protein DS421_12g375800 [Arachis hypogaea]